MEHYDKAMDTTVPLINLLNDDRDSKIVDEAFSAGQDHVIDKLKRYIGAYEQGQLTLNELANLVKGLVYEEQYHNQWSPLGKEKL